MKNAHYRYKKSTIQVNDNCRNLSGSSLFALLGQINIIFEAINTLVLNFFFNFVSNKKIENHLNRK